MASYSQLTEKVRNIYSTFSPTDITILLAGQEIGMATSIQFSMFRQKIPAYTFGHVNPRAFSRGQRAMEGVLGEATLSGLSIYFALKTFLDENYIYRPAYDRWRKMISRKKYGENEERWVEETYESYKRAMVKGIVYLDEVYPVDIVLVGVDEFGNVAKMEMFGCEFTTDNIGIDMNDAGAIKTNIAFVARDGRPFYHVIDSKEE